MTGKQQPGDEPQACDGDPGCGVDVCIRPATEADLTALVRIYNHYIENTPITFDTSPITVRDRLHWFTTFRPDGPYRLLVAARDGCVLGYACSDEFKARDAYRTSVETTIYMDPDATGEGVGTALYAELVRQLVADERLHRAYAGISMPNDASVALHEKLGFRQAGLYSEVGYKFDRYWDVAWFERDLSA